MTEKPSVLMLDEYSGRENKNFELQLKELSRTATLYITDDFWDVEEILERYKEIRLIVFKVFKPSTVEDLIAKFLLEHKLSKGVRIIGILYSHDQGRVLMKAAKFGKKNFDYVVGHNKAAAAIKIRIDALRYKK